MKKKKTIHIRNKYENTLLNREHFNPYQTGHGAFNNKKYDVKSIRSQGRAICRNAL